MYLIGNNHGHMNGIVNRNQIYGKVTEILDKGIKYLSYMPPQHSGSAAHL